MTKLLLVLLLVTQAERAAKETSEATDLYGSSEGYRTCVTATIAEAEARMAYLRKSGPATQLKMTLAVEKRKTVCGEAIVIKLSEGEQVEVSPNLGACAVPDSDKATPKMSRVRLTAGEHAGTVGCVVESHLRDAVPF